MATEDKQDSGEFESIEHIRVNSCNAYEAAVNIRAKARRLHMELHGSDKASPVAEKATEVEPKGTYAIIESNLNSIQECIAELVSIMETL